MSIERPEQDKNRTASLEMGTSPLPNRGVEAGDVNHAADALPPTQLSETEKFSTSGVLRNEQLIESPNAASDSLRSQSPEQRFEPSQGLGAANEVKPSVSDSDLAARSGLTDEKYQEIRDMPKESRPDPKEYLSQEYIKDSLSEFQSAHRYQSDVAKWGIGRKDGAFVTPSDVGSDGTASNKGGKAVHIEMNGVENVQVNMPSGKESGANEEWGPGGWDRASGNREAVITGIPDRPANRLFVPREKDER